MIRPLSRPAALLAVVASLICGIAVSLGVAEDARAAGWDGCATGRLCVYAQAEGTGTARSFGPADDGQGYDDSWDDAAVSVWNDTSYWACVYDGTGYGGTLQALRPGFRGNLSLASNDLTNKVSSHKLAKSKAGCWTGYERCPDHSLCLFQDPGGRGPMTSSTADDPRYGADWDNKAVSVFNRTGLHACFYRAPDFTSTWTVDGRAYKAYVVLKGDSTVVPAPYAPAFSSHRLVRGTSEC
ncbi:peptidase inhibitor family I36 protein [Streptomyces sp. NPDC001941]|uniref:peptidase inhibitor family I36 protein n=1 Tax=Streptomyces sp. NPDC001941 TaxID=3154659 RepID=UPI00332F89B9